MIAAHIVRFYREKGSNPEVGIAIVLEPGLSNIITMVDSNGIIVPEVHDYTLMPYHGSILLPTMSELFGN